jgi:HEPN domain-containing protein
MIGKADLETLAGVRLEDAKQLFASGQYSGAYYLSGYAIELAIKASIAKVFKANSIPDKAFVNAIYSHNLKDLLSLGGG